MTAPRMTATAARMRIQRQIRDLEGVLGCTSPAGVSGSIPPMIPCEPRSAPVADRIIYPLDCKERSGRRQADPNNPAETLIANPRIDALNRKEISACAITTLRIACWVVATSAVWQAAAIVKEKYAKSQKIGIGVFGNSNGRFS